MFYFYFSYDLENALKKICKIIKKKPLNNVFDKEIFITPDKKINFFLKSLIAKNINIFANIKLLTINSFVSYIYSCFFLGKEHKYFFSKNIMKCNIMYNKKIWSLLKKIHKKNLMKYWEISSLFAETFYRYMIFSPNIVINWEKKNICNFKDKNEILQCKVWQHVINNKKLRYNFSQLLFMLKKNIKKKKTKLPQRFFLIFNFYIPKYYLKILEELKKVCKIYILIYNISKDFLKNKNIYYNKYFSINIWYKYTKKIIYELQATNKKKIVFLFKKKNKKTILYKLKKKIFKINNKKDKIIKKISLSKKDDSLQIKYFNSRKKELKNLNKYLFNQLKKNKKLEPRQILILSCDLKKYKPFINSIFQSYYNNYCIPYILDQINDSKYFEIVNIFEKLMYITDSRFYVKDIMKLLEFSHISKKFDINRKDLKILSLIIKASRIKCFLNKKQIKKLKICNIQNRSWEDGLNKIILGFILREKDGLWKGINPVETIDTYKAELIGKLYEFLFFINKWYVLLSKKKYIKLWSNICKKLIHDFFYINKKNKKYLLIITKKWDDIIKNHFSFNSYEKVEINLLRKILIEKIKHINHYSKFKTNSVIFSQNKNLTLIPFKIISFIGFNNDFFKNKTDINFFDLINIRNENLYNITKIYNNYLFLQSILSSKCSIYFSCYTNDNKYEKHFLLNNIKKHLLNNFYEEKKKNKNKIFFLENKKIKDNKLDNLKKISIYIKKKKQNIDFNIELNSLINFWKNPIKSFFQKTLNIYFFEKRNSHQRNKYLINYIDKYNINLQILNKKLNNKSTKNIFHKYKSLGVLPSGNFDKILWNNQKQKIMELVNKINIKKVLNRKHYFSIKINKYNLHGFLQERKYKNKIIKVVPKNVNINDYIELWFEHLCFCIINNHQNMQTDIIGFNKNNWSFKKLKKKTAKKYLLKYIKGYLIGISKPLIITQTGYYMYYKYYNKENILDKNLFNEIFLKKWQGNNYIKGEKKDLYVKQIISKLDKKNIKQMYNISKKWLYPLIKYKI
ncbi:exodeoxyribonuclease V subunit gamma [Buchnera aphidicola (Taiwanaphis decaspermi)]|uniref:exodeoxyribonuclease V subunit gamma n=1 Tax=Buchnera aphidicola TaxID=9 RepID=UPI0031B8A878